MVVSNKFRLQDWRGSPPEFLGLMVFGEISRVLAVHANRVAIFARLRSSLWCPLAALRPGLWCLSYGGWGGGRGGRGGGESPNKPYIRP